MPDPEFAPVVSLPPEPQQPGQAALLMAELHALRRVAEAAWPCLHGILTVPEFDALNEALYALDPERHPGGPSPMTDRNHWLALVRVSCPGRDGPAVVQLESPLPAELASKLLALLSEHAGAPAAVPPRSQSPGRRP